MEKMRALLAELKNVLPQSYLRVPVWQTRKGRMVVTI